MAHGSSCMIAYGLLSCVDRLLLAQTVGNLRLHKRKSTNSCLIGR